MYFLCCSSLRMCATFIQSINQSIKSNQIKSNQIKSNQIKSNQIKSNQIKSNQIKSNQIKSNQIKSNQIKSNQIDHSIIRQLNDICNEPGWRKSFLLRNVRGYQPSS